MIRIGFVGVPGAGKTTTARALAGILRQETNYKTIELVSEYARAYIHKYGSIDSVYDQMRIFNKQLAEENQFPSTIDVLVTDSPIFLGFGYALELRKENNKKDTMLINDLFKEMNKCNDPPRYDFIFHLPPVLKPVKDGIRSDLHFDDKWRAEADKKLLSIFYVFKPKNLITISAINLSDRLKEVINYLK